MLEHLSLVVSLYKLLTDGLKKIGDKLKSSRKKSVQRKIIEIQLILEDIIEKAQEVISTTNKYSKAKKVNRSDIEKLRRMLYSQRNLIRILLDHLRDDTSEEIMKLFTPDIRRSIISLIHIKGGVIEYVLFMLNYLFDIQLVKNQPVIYTNKYLSDWNHDKFLQEGNLYIQQLSRKEQKAKVPIFKLQIQQEKVVNELIKCSNELSNFIRSQINMEDFISSGRNKKYKKSL